MSLLVFTIFYKILACGHFEQYFWISIFPLIKFMSQRTVKPLKIDWDSCRNSNKSLMKLKTVSKDQMDEVSINTCCFCSYFSLCCRVLQKHCQCDMPWGNVRFLSQWRVLTNKSCGLLKNKCGLLCNVIFIAHKVLKILPFSGQYLLVLIAPSPQKHMFLLYTPYVLITNPV